jgi:acetolactate synthase-1/2/3 large subunit
MSITSSGAGCIIEFFKMLEIEYVFGIAGAALIPIISEIEKTESINYISARHEQIAAHMADGYARHSGKPGIVIVTRSAGAANSVVGVMTAYSSDSPIIIISGDVPVQNYGKGDYQEFDLVTIFKPMTKYSTRINDASNIQYFLEKSVRIAISERPGPVFLSIPGNLMNEEINFNIDNFKKIKKVSETLPKIEILKEVIDLILKADNPVVLAGNGINYSNASKELLNLVEKFALPLVPSHYGPLDIVPTNHPLLFQDSDIFSKCDLLLAIGTNIADIRSWQKFGNPKKVIQFESSLDLIGKYFTPDISVVSEIKLTLQKLAEQSDNQLNQEKKMKIKERYKTLSEYKNSFLSKRWPNEEWDETPIRPWRLIKDIRETFPYESIIVHDSGSFSTSWIRRCMDFHFPKTYYCCLGGIMGFALPGALGIKLADPTKDVVTIIGDGSFMMVPSTIITSVQYNIPIIIIINNNQSYMQIKRRQSQPYTGSILFNPNFVEFGESMGVKSRQIDDPTKLVETFRWSLEENRKGKTVLLDIITTNKTEYATPNSFFNNLI